jgi:hypothetical protein
MQREKTMATTVFILTWVLELSLSVFLLSLVDDTSFLSCK